MRSALGVMASSHPRAAGGAVVTLLATGVANPTNLAGVNGFTTGSVSPGADCALVLFVGSMGRSSTLSVITASVATSSGSGPTWTRRASAGGLSYSSGAAVLTAAIGGTDPGAFTVTWDDNTVDNITSTSWALYKITGHSPFTTFVGAAAQTAAANGAVTLTLAATPASGDAVLAFCYQDSDAGGSTFNTGWTEDLDYADDSRNRFPGGNVGHRTDLTTTSVSWLDVNTADPNDSFSSAQAAIIVKSAGGPVADYDASVAGSFTLSGSEVVEWRPIVGGHSFDRISVGEGPARTGTLNGLSKLEFDGTNDRLLIDSWTALAQPCTIMAVIRPDDLNETNQSIITQGSFRMLSLRSTDEIFVNAGGGASDLRFTTTLGNWGLLTVVLNDTASVLRWNGVQMDTGSPGTAGIAGTFYLGFAEGPERFCGGLAALRFYDIALSGAELTSAENIVMTKWGL